MEDEDQRPAVEFACAECGTTEADTYVVTGSVSDREGRTEVCLICHYVLAGLTYQDQQNSTSVETRGC